MKNIMIIGATSAMATETAYRFAAEGAKLFLVGRRAKQLDDLAIDLRSRGASHVSAFALDLTLLDQHEPMLEAATSALGTVDAVLVAYGVLPDQQDCEVNVSCVLDTYQTNCLSVIALLTLLANRFEKAGSGCLAVISSVAGDRGRQSNYVYGSSKAAVSTFLEGLRNRLHKKGVAVVTIKPGLTDSPMTAHLPKNALYSTPATVAKAIHTGMKKRRNIVYAPGFWRWVMLAIRLIPEPLFKRLSL